MPKAKQLTVSCDDQPGTLSHIARILGDASVNILAFQCGTEGHQGVVRVVVDNANKARKALTAAELPFTESDVLLQELPHTPGALGFFAGKMSHKGVNSVPGQRRRPRRRREWWCSVFRTSRVRRVYADPISASLPDEA